MDSGAVSLQRWLRRQLRQPTPLREHLEAAIANDDPDEARRVVARFDGFSREQRRYVDVLIDGWARERGNSAAAGEVEGP